MRDEIEGIDYGIALTQFGSAEKFAVILTIFLAQSPSMLAMLKNQNQNQNQRGRFKIAVYETVTLSSGENMGSKLFSKACFSTSFVF